jgi:uncharacterized protein YeaO (DUF488 family)
MLKIKRVYEEPSEDDGRRILVDRLWPRGLSKDKARIDLWMRDISPSDELRKWFGHDSSRWEEFRRRYWKELEENEGSVAQLEIMEGKGNLTLVFGRRDELHNNAIVLKEYLDSRRSHR